jgi:integrase
MIHAWAGSTQEAYGSGILAFHVYCDSKSIGESSRAPASSELIAAFISDLAGSYSGKTIASYVHGVRAWHILHGKSWSLDDDRIDTMLKAAKNLTPSSSKRKKRPPYTIDFITSILQKLDSEDPLDAAVRSCLTTAFYSIARAGEFTVKNLSSFDPSLHVKRSDIHHETDRNGRATTVFHLPRTKTSQAGEDVFWAKQNGPTDPSAALLNHLRINDPLPEIALFSYKFGSTHRPLTKTKFIGRLARAAKDAGLDPLQGHAIRIGATLEYLLRNVPFDVVKTMGRWASDAFQLYLRNHAQILAPYLQATPVLQDEFLRITMPQVR